VIWIIIAVHNRRDFTKVCLESLSGQSYKEFKIIVVDDGSKDGTAQMIQTQYPDVRILMGDGSLFWSKATNLGVDEALQHAKNEDFILTLNNDVTVKADYLEKLMDSASRFPRALIGSIALNHKDNDDVIDGGVEINWLTAKFKNLGKGKKYSELVQKNKWLYSVDVLPGRGTLIPIEIFKKIGLYNDAQLPQYGADYEFSVRAKKAGYSLFINYEAIVISNPEATGLNNGARMLRWREYLKSFFSIRSPNNLYYRWHFSRLCCPGVKGFLFYILDTIRVILGSLRNQIVQPLK